METVSLNVNRICECDVCVVGGGVGGVSAAVSAARYGANTILIESTGCLGGQATLGLVTPLDARKSRDGKHFGGLIDEIFNETKELSDKYCAADDASEGYAISPHVLKYVLIEKADNAGVSMHFHTSIISAKTSGNKITAIYATDKSGIIKIKAKTFIDASGDAVLTALSGAENVVGSEHGVYDILMSNDLDKAHFSDTKHEAYSHDGMMQPVSIFILIGGLTDDAREKAMALNNKVLKFGDLGISKEKFLAWKFAGTCGFELDGDKIPMPQGRILLSKTPRNDVVAVNMSRVIGIDGSDASSLNEGEVKAQKQVIAIVDFLKTFIPGFENAYYIQSGFTLGVRESRRMVGRYVLTGNDAINCRTFEHCVARGSYLIDIHDPSGKAKAIGGAIKGAFYDIPYECLVSKTYDNLLACGRCISSDHVAHASTRIQGTCIMTGQAVGTAAAIAAKKDIDASDIDVSYLREVLIADGVYIN